ncbi:transcription termination factor 5, mitochondrial [Ceratina calcarata]|uniref:Transcription termination factor 5, mitochondrial n=1 Tax=Ceratina calcarata TaxID=156304 RepID=A0AAJ7JCX6_9HYME|nr:transcription termination factor 5, mitochondrial [Ceratina calcarata]
MLRQPFVTKMITICRGKSVSFFSTEGDIHNILATHLQVDQKAIEKLYKIKAVSIITKIPTKQLIQNCAILQNMQVNLEEIEYLAHCLMIQPMVMRNRISILKEMGVESVELQHIYRFPGSMRKSVTKFMESHNIPAKESYFESVFSNIGVKIDNSNTDTKMLNNKMRMGDYYATCMIYYKKHHLKLYDDTFHRNKRMKYLSFAELSRLLKILKHKCKLNDTFLKENPYLLHLDLDKVEKFLSELKSVRISGKNIMDVIKQHPRVLFYEPKKVKELLQLCKTLGVPDRTIASYIHVLGMDKGTFLERYMQIANQFELGVWLQHSRVLCMIYSYKLVSNRVNYLRPLSYINNANINTYLAEKRFFLRFVEGEIHHTAVRKFLLYVLRKELGEDKVYLINSIERHPYWKHIPLMHIDQMLRFLKKNFTVEDICLNIHVILYPRSKVVEVLNLIYENYSQQKGYNFTPTQYLAMCLYKLEKKYHFTGDAVWQTVHNEISDLNPHLFEDIKPNESDSLVKYINENDNEMVNVSGAAWLEYLLQSR